MPSSQYPKLELKYCERCGGLWVRPRGSEAVYCGPCAAAIRDLPPLSRTGGAPPNTAMDAACAMAAAVPAAVYAAADVVAEVFA